MAPQARLSLHMSKCHIVGNHTAWLNYVLGEASINTIDGSMYWQLMPQNHDKDEPMVNNPEFISIQTQKYSSMFETLLTGRYLG